MSVAVLDASTFVLGLSARSRAAEGWIENAYAGRVAAVAPDLVHAEVANALLIEHRVKGVPLHSADFVLDRLLAFPLSVIPLDVLVSDALSVAASRQLSVYDACYVALAEANDAVLVTADRKLAAATNRAELILD